jgi:hypothetical protein
MANDKDELVLGIEAQKEIIEALLIGLHSYGEIERVSNQVEKFDYLATENPSKYTIPKSARPIHPTGSADTIGVFASALRYMQQV